MASKVLPAVYSGFEDLRTGCFHFLGSLQAIHHLHASLHYSLVWRTATGHQMKLKWLEKKEGGNQNMCTTMGFGHKQQENEKQHNKKKNDPVAVESALSTKYKENSSSHITQQLPLQFIKRHHRKAWKTARPPLWNPKQHLWVIRARRRKIY